MRNRTVISLLALVALASLAGAHEGHHHTAMGTVEGIDDKQITLTIEGEESTTFALTDETTFKRGDEEVTAEDATVGERAVVMYQTKDKINVALEVKLPAGAD